jgi:hypothetical protein
MSLEVFWKNLQIEHPWLELNPGDQFKIIYLEEVDAPDGLYLHHMITLLDSAPENGVTNCAYWVVATQDVAIEREGLNEDQWNLLDEDQKSLLIKKASTLKIVVKNRNGNGTMIIEREHRYLPISYFKDVLGILLINY